MTPKMFDFTLTFGGRDHLDQPQAMKIAQALGMQGYLLSVEEVISALEKP